jgi:DNA invertase Pin-like site-specific DNA recombinase
MGWTIVGEFVDLASATDMRGRVQWRDLLAKVRRGGIDVVVVLRLDRAFRSSLDTHDTLALLESYRVKFVAVAQPELDTTSALGKMVLAIAAAFAEFERDIIRQRTLDGLARARSQGKRLGRPPGSKDKRRRKKTGYLLSGAVQRGEVGV